MEELRKTNRVPFTAKIEQLLKYGSDYPKLGGDDEFITARALNLSPGGIGCESLTTIQPLSHVYMIFSVPTADGGRQIRCEGFVAHSSYDGEYCVFGIRFHSLSPADQSAIDDYIRAQGER